MPRGSTASRCTGSGQGVSGGTREEAIRILSRNIEDPLTPSILAAEGVRYAVVHDDAYRDLGREPPRPADGMTHAATFGSTRVYVVTAEPADLKAELARHRAEIAMVQGLEQPTLKYVSGFYDPEPFNGTERRWLGANARDRRDENSLRRSLSTHWARVQCWS